MNLVKWFRKNNKKVMAVLVIIIMFGFVGGSALQRLLEGRGTGLRKTVAHFGDNREITNNDLFGAHRELEILKMVQADTMLRSFAEPVFRTPELRALLLGQLLFSDRKASPMLIGQVKQIIGRNDYRISSKQINDIYRGSMPTNVYWLLLEKEAELAGIKWSNENAGQQLAGTISQLSRVVPRLSGVTYSQLIGAVVNRQGIPEKEILTTFGKLLAVLEYARMVCSSEDVTAQQVMHNISRTRETIDVEFVRFDSSEFAEAQEEPTEQEIRAHFDKYKKFSSGAVSEENAYGFGYKLDDRVQLEYIAVKLDDISGIVAKPTQEETEEYYQRYRDQFTEQVLSDPNDPNSPPTERIRSYVEVASDISSLLVRSKKRSKAELILQEAKTLTEAGFEDTDIEDSNLNGKDFKAMAGDYETTAEQLSEKYNIKVYAGQTGLLSAADMGADEQLGRLYVRGFGNNPVGLTQVVFAIDELEASELGPFDVAKPRMYENIGPARDITEQIMAVVRVIRAEEASEPESVNQTFSISAFGLEQRQEQAGEGEPNSSKDLGREDVYSVREKVVKDLRRLAAMETTKSKAGEFVRQVAEDGWEGAVEKFNELYGKAEANESDANAAQMQEAISGVGKPFRLQKLTNLPRISSMGLETLAVHNMGNPAGQLSVDMARKESKLRDRLYSLVPEDSNSVETVPLVLEFKPDMNYYCLKAVSVRRVYRDEYERVKAVQVYKEDVVQSQSLGAVHFNPENISRRMNFRWVEEKTEGADANAASGSEETL